MKTKDYGKIIAKNLKRILLEKGKTQTEVARDLNINKSTLSCWMNGTRIPKMESIDMLCAYLGCKRSDIMEDPDVPRETISVSDDQAELVRLTLKASPENVKVTLALLRKLEDGRHA